MMTNVAATSDITVFIARRDVTCGECGEALGRHAWITLDRDRGALCLACADLDHLVFLPAGNTARRHDEPRSTRPSPPSCWNGAAHANVTSGRACWWRRRLWPKLKRNAWPTPMRGSGAARVKSSAAPKKTRSMWRALPRPSASCILPAHLAREQVIAEHACRKYSGRVGRSAAAKKLDAEAVRLAVIAHVRHAETTYDQLLSQGYERRDARGEVEGQVARVLARWAGAM